MTVIRIQSGVSCIYDSDVNLTDLSVINLNSVGSTYTYIVSGSPGATGFIEVSVDGNEWYPLVLLTVPENGTYISTTLKHVIPYLRASGTGRVQICRGVS